MINEKRVGKSRRKQKQQVWEREEYDWKDETSLV